MSFSLEQRTVIVVIRYDRTTAPNSSLMEPCPPPLMSEEAGCRSARGRAAALPGGAPDSSTVHAGASSGQPCDHDANPTSTDDSRTMRRSFRAMAITPEERSMQQPADTS